MIHRIFFDVGYEDFSTSTELFIKYPKAKIVAKKDEEATAASVEIEGGKFLVRYI